MSSRWIKARPQTSSKGFSQIMILEDFEVVYATRRSTLKKVLVLQHTFLAFSILSAANSSTNSLISLSFPGKYQIFDHWAALVPCSKESGIAFKVSPKSRKMKIKFGCSHRLKIAQGTPTNYQTHMHEENFPLSLPSSICDFAFFLTFYSFSF